MINYFKLLKKFKNFYLVQLLNNYFYPNLLNLNKNHPKDLVHLIFYKDYHQKFFFNLKFLKIIH